MSSLQIGLAIAGGVVLVAVVAHSAWTSRKNRPRQADPLPPADPTASLASPQEPVWTPTLHLPEAPLEAPVPPPVREPQEPTLSSAPSRVDGADPVKQMAMAMMQEATLHAQRVPDEAELARLQALRDRDQAQQAAQAQERANQAQKAAVAQAVADVLQPVTEDLPAPEKRLAIDALIDVISPIEPDHPVYADVALAALTGSRRVGSKPFLIEGLHVDTGEWEPLRTGQRYSLFQTAVQLANRTGALNEIEFSEYVRKSQQFADAINAAVEFPDMMEAVSRARELDQFASAHDAQLSFTLKAIKSAWSPGYIHQNAARMGFVPGVMPGRLVVPASRQGLPPILGLTFDTQAALSEDPAQSAVRELTLSLDVPQVDRREEPFARMVQVALELARVMDGAVTDDNGQGLTEAALTAIARDLLVLYDTLDARDLAAGSAQARRLFS